MRVPRIVATCARLATFRRKKQVFEKRRENLAARHYPTNPVGL
jgi:hypothetical protein